MATTTLHDFLNDLVAINVGRVLSANGLTKIVEEKQVSREAYYTTAVEREGLIFQLLNELTGNIRNMAVRLSLDFEDMYQEACLKIMQLVDSPRVEREYLARYTNVAIQNLLRDKGRYQRRRDEVLSLDAPSVYCGGDVTFGDVIPSPYSVDPLDLLLLQEDMESLLSDVQHMRGSHGKAVRDRYETALATC